MTMQHDAHIESLDEIISRLQPDDLERLIAEFRPHFRSDTRDRVDLAEEFKRWVRSEHGPGFAQVYTSLKDNVFWDEKQHEYGAYHRANKFSDVYVPEVLLVLIHGILGDTLRTWDDEDNSEGGLAKHILREARIDIDVWSFGYPARIHERASITRAARDLQEFLRLEAREYRHLFFIVHSTGGLVVKKLIVDELAQLTGAETQPSINPGDMISLTAFRSRRVVNITVPHNGGALIPTLLGNIIYHVLFPFFAPLALAARLASGGSVKWGYNAIIAQLFWQNPWLKRLETTYSNSVNACVSAGFPRPISDDLIASDDIAAIGLDTGNASRSAERYLKTDSRKVVVRGTHGSVKRIKNTERALVRTLLGGVLRKYKKRANLEVAVQTVKRAYLVDREGKIDNLVSGERGGKPILTFSQAGTQENVRAQLRQFVMEPASRPRRRVITGAAGVGKSVVLRRLTRELALDYLESESEEEILPIFFPLQGISLSDDNLTKQSRTGAFRTAPWPGLVDEWIDFVHGLIDAGNTEQTAKLATKDQIDATWLSNQLTSFPTVLVLDGIDEFLINNPSLGISDIVAMLHDLEEACGANDRLYILLGLRMSLPERDIVWLAGGRNQILEVVSLTEGQAEALFPGAQAVLRNVEQSDLRELLLTPLILAQLGPRLSELTQRTFKTRSEIMEVALETLILGSGLPDFELRNRASVGVSVWLEVLALAALVFFRRFRSEVTLTEIQDHVPRYLQQWRKYLRSRPDVNSDLLLDQEIGIAVEPNALEVLLTRTVFIPTGRSRYRFIHTAWQDLLLSRYLVRCVLSQNYLELGRRAFFTSIYSLAAEQMRNQEITKAFIDGALDAGRDQASQFVVGNIMPLVARRHMLVERSAVATLLSRATRLPRVLRLVVFDQLAVRALRGEDDDNSAHGVKRELTNAIRDWRDIVEIKNDTVLSSLLWCYQKAFANRENGGNLDYEWPGSTWTDREIKNASEMLCTHASTGVTISVTQRSMQIAFRAILDMLLLEGEYRSISTIHYLFPLVCAYQHGGLIGAVERDLGRIIQKESDICSILESYSLVPEVGWLWRLCVDIYQGKGGWIHRSSATPELM